MVRHEGLVFGSCWYEPGPSTSDAPAYTQAFVQQAINLYDALGLEETIAYYNTEESVDGQWYAFIVDRNGYTIAHHNPDFRGRDPSLRVDATGHFYGDDLLGATEEGRWVDYVLLNPETGDDRQKHTWAVLYDGLIFASGWYLLDGTRSSNYLNTEDGRRCGFSGGMSRKPAFTKLNQDIAASSSSHADRI